jgi:predicted nuclease with RNAse H fold
VGVDLAGVERNPTGVAVLRAGRLEWLGSLSTDEEIHAVAALPTGGGVLAINAPLALPLGRCCLDDDCRCRYEPGVRSRKLERQLRRMGVPILATALIKILARRGLRLATSLPAAGVEPLIEV